jgi:ribosomal protein S18 acetylase RimI-like enzyme
MRIDDVITIPSPLGPMTLRPEREDDQAFRYELFRVSRPPEWDMVQLDPQLREQLDRHQFAAQTSSYRTQFAKARFDIIEFGGERIGRIVVDRPGNELHIVDQAIVPHMRNKGLGTAMMRVLMDEAARAGIPVRLTVASTNDPSLRLYLRLGFVETGAVPMYVEMHWTAPAVDNA